MTWGPIHRLVHKISKRFRKSPATTLATRYPQYTIGRGTYGDLNVLSWGERATVSVGNYTSIATGVKVFLGGEHRTDWVTTFPFNVLWTSAKQHAGHPKTKGNVAIGNDVWIGTEAIVSSGVTIGDGAVVGARAVVTSHVAPYAVVVGNPARVVKFRFDPQIIERLLLVKWWDWDERTIEMAMPELLSDQIELFLEKAERAGYR